jgi:hypothetical protein
VTGTTEPTNKDLENHVLGVLPEEESERLLDILFVNPGLYDRYVIVERDMIDRYVRNKMPAEMRAAFVENYLMTAENREKVRVAALFHEELQKLLHEELVVGRTPAGAWFSGIFTHAFSRAAFAGVAIVLLGLMIGLLIYRGSDTRIAYDKGAGGTNVGPGTNVRIDPPINDNSPELVKNNHTNQLTPPNLKMQEKPSKDYFATVRPPQIDELKYGGGGTMGGGRLIRLDRRNYFWRPYFNVLDDCPSPPPLLNVKLIQLKTNSDRKAVFEKPVPVNKKGNVRLRFQMNDIKDGSYELRAVNGACKVNLNFTLVTKR